MDQNDPIEPDATLPGAAASAAAALQEKLRDMQAIGVEAVFDPDEAELAGAFLEDALSASDAAASRLDALEEDLHAPGDMGP